MKGTSVFYKGMDSRLQCFYLDGTGAYQHAWIDSNWNTTAYSVSSKPGSIVSGNQSDIFYLGTDDRIHLFSYQNNTWQHTLLPYAYGSPSLGYPNGDYVKGSLSWDNARMRVVYVGYDGRLQYFTSNNGAWEHYWLDDYWGTSEFSSFNSSQTSTYSASLSTNAAGTTFYCDQNNHLRYFKYEPCENVDLACGSSTSILRTAKPAVVPPGVQTQQTNDKLLLYPNPAQTQITIELPTSLSLTAPGQWILYTSTGTQILKGPVSSNKFVINLETLAQGLYSLEVLVDKTKLTQRLVKE